MLKSSDGETFEVEEEVSMKLINPEFEDCCAGKAINLHNITSKILSKVLEYCKKHVEARNDKEKSSSEDLKMWDSDFVKVDQSTLFDLALTANYLNIMSLIDLTCQACADMIIKGKTPEEIRKIIIKNDFTLEEEEEVRRENQWAFE